MVPTSTYHFNTHPSRILIETLVSEFPLHDLLHLSVAEWRLLLHRVAAVQVQDSVKEFLPHVETGTLVGDVRQERVRMKAVPDEI